MNSHCVFLPITLILCIPAQASFINHHQIVNCQFQLCNTQNQIQIGPDFMLADTLLRQCWTVRMCTFAMQGGDLPLSCDVTYWNVTSCLSVVPFNTAVDHCSAVVPCYLCMWHLWRRATMCCRQTNRMSDMVLKYVDLNTEHLLQNIRLEFVDCWFKC